ncbi:MAG: AAA family ATPase [Bacteroidetes bacterium]|nr:AAA family ATPase [Bacteroidota bacterium]
MRNEHLPITNAKLPDELIEQLKKGFSEIDTSNEPFLRALFFLEYSTRSVFITGKAGTGKSTLVKLFKTYTKKKVVILAPTGIAAINVGGQTIHSFFKFPTRPILPGDREIRRFRHDSEEMQLLQSADVILIDEISMVRADLLDAIHQSLCINLGNTKAAFGGKQMVFIGDPFQLPPVVTKEDQDIMAFLYPTPYFFNAYSFNRRFIEMIELEKVYRQNDLAYLELLNKMRQSQSGWDDINALNKRYFPNYNPGPNDYVITLCTTNANAKRINENQLAQLDTKEFTYKGEIDGNYPTSGLPTEQKLALKVGAQVMFIRNDQNGKWVNGTIARITDLTNHSIDVLLEDGQTYRVEPHEWENKKYTWDLEKRKIEQEVLGTFTQFPLKLAWAITIHKSQGLTFEKAVIDLGRGAFAHGQFYVALSRCRSFAGLALKQRAHLNDIIVDPIVNKAHQKGFLNDGELKLGA